MNHFAITQWLIIAILCSSPHALNGLVQTRRSTLFPWKQQESIIGWVQESRDDDAETLKVQVGWGDAADDSSTVMTVSLPYLQRGSLGSTLWPPALAGAILCRSPVLTDWIQSKNVLELGSGLGLVGQVISKSSGTNTPNTVICSDHDAEVMQALQEHLAHVDDDPSSGVENNNNNNNNNNVQTKVLEWRDDVEASGLEPHSFNMVVGTDVAYYSYLLQPLLDTARCCLTIRDESSLLYIVGQAHRESQWDLLNLIKSGGYSQKTDRHEPPLPGDTNMLLYRLEMQAWQDDVENDDDDSDKQQVVQHHDDNHESGSVPIAVLTHTMPGLTLPALTEYDYTATANDESTIDRSF